MNSDNNDQNTVNICFKYEDGRERIVKAPIGDTLLEVSRQFDLHIEGACGGSCACATCHVWVEDKWFRQLAPASDAEEDMLDNAQQLTRTSRLCCQIEVDKTMNGMEITIPNSTYNENGHHH